MIDNLAHVMGVLTGWVAILMPVLLFWVIFHSKTKEEIKKYDSILEIAEAVEKFEKK